MNYNNLSKLTCKFSQSNQTVFVILILIVLALLTEVSAVKNYDLINTPPLSSYLAMVIVFTLGQFYLLNLVKSRSRGNEINSRLNAISYKIVIISNCALILILSLVYVQMVLTSSYNTFAITIILTISYGVSAVMLGILAQRFISWFNVHRTLVVLVYGLAAVTLAANAIITLGFVSITLSKMYDAVGPHRGAFAYVGYPGSLEFSLHLVYNIFSVLSFVVTWLATALLLHSYSKRLGALKYWTIVSLPLVYFLSQFPSVFLNLFSPLLNSDPAFYSLLLSIVFTLSKASGGIFFGIAFWIMAQKTAQGTVVREYLIIAAIGFVLLFVADQALVLLYIPYPPFGLASASFMALSSYLMLTGIYSSAIYISQDSKLRQTIRNIAIRDWKLLDSIGICTYGTRNWKKCCHVIEEKSGLD